MDPNIQTPPAEPAVPTEGRWTRCELLFGPEGIRRLQASAFIVINTSDAGSYTCEAIARSSVGSLNLVPAPASDLLQLTRKEAVLVDLASTAETPSMSPAERLIAQTARLADINPDCVVHWPISRFATVEHGIKALPELPSFVERVVVLDVRTKASLSAEERGAIIHQACRLFGKKLAGFVFVALDAHLLLYSDPSKLRAIKLQSKSSRRATGSVKQLVDIISSADILRSLASAGKPAIVAIASTEPVNDEHTTSPSPSAPPAPSAPRKEEEMSGVTEDFDHSPAHPRRCATPIVAGALGLLAAQEALNVALGTTTGPISEPSSQGPAKRANIEVSDAHASSTEASPAGI
jgi:hypothetical protein